jgi:DNA-binding MarR family transcriptional regulator
MMNEDLANTAKWTLITNHAAVLLHIAQHPRTTARDIATAAKITERATRKIIADLDEVAFITKKKEGRRILYTINPDAKMRHDKVEDVVIGTFLEALGWQKVTIEVEQPLKIGKPVVPLVSLFKSPESRANLVDDFYAHLF